MTGNADVDVNSY